MLIGRYIYGKGCLPTLVNFFLIYSILLRQLNVFITFLLNILIKIMFSYPLMSSRYLLDSCHRTAFSFNNSLYEQVDGVSMGSSLGPVLTHAQGNGHTAELNRGVGESVCYLQFIVSY